MGMGRRALQYPPRAWPMVDCIETCGSCHGGCNGCIGGGHQ